MSIGQLLKLHVGIDIDQSIEQEIDSFGGSFTKDKVLDNLKDRFDGDLYHPDVYASYADNALLSLINQKVRRRKRQALKDDKGQMDYIGSLGMILSVEPGLYVTYGNAYSDAVFFSQEERKENMEKVIASYQTFLEFTNPILEIQLEHSCTAKEAMKKMGLI